MFDQKQYQETFAQVHASEETLSEVLNMTRKNKNFSGVRVTRMLVAAVIITAMLATSAFAYVGFTQYENPMVMLDALFGREKHSEGGITADATFDRVALDEILAREAVAPYIAAVNKCVSYDDYTLTVLAHQFDSVTNTGTIYYTLENPNGISGYEVFEDGQIWWPDGTQVMIINAHGNHFIVWEETTDTKLTVACCYVRGQFDTENYVGVEMTDRILAEDGIIATDVLKAFEERNQTIKLGLDDGGGMDGITLGEGSIRLSPIAIRLETVKTGPGVLTGMDHVQSLVIRYEDGTEYIVQDETVTNYAYACTDAYGEETVFALNRLVDVEKVKAVIIDGVEYDDVQPMMEWEHVNVPAYVEEVTEPQREVKEFDGIVQVSEEGNSISYEGYTLTAEKFAFDSETRAGVLYFRLENPDGIKSYELTQIDRIMLDGNVTVEATQYGNWFLNDEESTDTVLQLSFHFVRINQESDGLKLYFGGSGADVLVDSATEDMLYYPLENTVQDCISLDDGTIRLSPIGMSVAYQQLQQETGSINAMIPIKVVIRYIDGREYLIVDYSEGSLISNAFAIDTRSIRGNQDQEGLNCFSFFDAIDITQVESVIYNGVEYTVD